MYIFYLTCVFLLFQLHPAQHIEGITEGNCEVEGISENDWNIMKKLDSIDDVETTKILFQGVPTNVKSGQACDKYFCIIVDDKSFKIVPSNNFSNIDGDVNLKTASPTIEIIQTINVNCTSGKERPLTFSVTVKDTNNHAPTFSESTYVYTLPMPMLPKNDITSFGKDIIVTDLDFSNKDITISTTYEGLVYKHEEHDKYSYKVQLQFSGLKKLKSPETFILKATDSGTPPKSTDVKVTFNIDKSNSEPPSFTKPSYLYDYDSKNIKIVARSGQEVMLESEGDELKCTIKETEYSTFFDEVVVDGQKIELSLKKPFDDGIIAEVIAQITIECQGPKDTGVSSADIIIYFKGDIPEGVVFSKKKYSAIYEIKGDIHDIQMEDIITLSKTEDDYNIIVEENLRDYFELKRGDVGWTLGKKKNLNEDILKYLEINVVIELSRKTNGKVLDEAFINLMLPNGEDGVYFNKPFFIGDYKYDDDGAGTMEPIVITLNSKNLNIERCGIEKNTYSKYFLPSCSGADKLEIKKNDTIPKNLLKTVTVPLSMWVVLKLGNIERTISTAILLNLSYDGETISTTPTITTETAPITPTTPDDCSYTGWIIAVVILLVLLVVYVAATVIYYIRRLRNRNERDYIPEPKRITPKSKPSISDEKKYKNVSTRRPTGFIRYNPDQDGSSIESEYGDNTIDNTNANKFLKGPDESFRKISDSSNSNRRNVAFVIPPPPPEPHTLSDELKKVLEEREKY